MGQIWAFKEGAMGSTLTEHRGVSNKCRQGVEVPGKVPKSFFPPKGNGGLEIIFLEI
jgi:hypothetical protein